MIRYFIEGSSDIELDRAAFERLRERHPQRLKILIVEEARALGLFISETQEWESLRAFCLRIGISQETFHHRLKRPHKPAGFQVRRGHRSGRILQVCSNAIADKFFGSRKKTAPFEEIAAK